MSSKHIPRYSYEQQESRLNKTRLKKKAVNKQKAIGSTPTAYVLAYCVADHSWQVDSMDCEIAGSACMVSPSYSVVYGRTRRI